MRREIRRRSVSSCVSPVLWCLCLRQTRHLHAPASQPRQHVVELRQFHLQPAFPGPRPEGKNVEDELGPIDDLDVELFFEVSLLRRRKILIENDGVRVVRCDGSREFTDFPEPMRVAASTLPRVWMTRSTTVAPRTVGKLRQLLQ